MKDFLRSAVLSLAIVIASVIIGSSILNAAKIISANLKLRETDASAKMISDLVKTLKERNVPQPIPGVQDQGALEGLGAKTVEGVTPGTNPVKGNASAPVLMVEFSDFECPFSRRFYEQTFPRLEKEYIASGKMKFAYRDLPLGFHTFAKAAAVAVRCAGAQGKYWQMFDKVLMGNSLDSGTFGKYAQELGVNVKSFQACQDRPEMKEAVENDSKDAQKFGAQGTPSFFINGRFVNGAQPFDVFKRIIDEELAKK